MLTICDLSSRYFTKTRISDPLRFSNMLQNVWHFVHQSLFQRKEFFFVPVEIRSSVKVVPIIWCLLLIGCPNCAVMHWVEREAVGGRACNIQFFTNNVLPWFWRVNSLISKTYLLHICSLPVRRTNCILRNVITHNPEHFTHHGAVHPGIQL